MLGFCFCGFKECLVLTVTCLAQRNDLLEQDTLKAFNELLNLSTTELPSEKKIHTEDKERPQDKLSVTASTGRKSCREHTPKITTIPLGCKANKKTPLM